MTSSPISIGGRCTSGSRETTGAIAASLSMANKGRSSSWSPTRPSAFAAHSALRRLRLRAEGVSIGQPLQHARGKSCAQPDIAHGIVSYTAFFHDQPRILLLESLDLAQAETHCVRCPDIIQHLAMQFVKALGRTRAWLESRTPERMVDIGQPHFDAVLARVAHDLRRRIKAHRLC